MARVLNLLIVILEIIAFSKCIKWYRIKKSFVFYTQISNLFTLISSVLLVIFGGRDFVEVMRFTSASMLVMTFLVTVFVLVPVTKDVRGLLLSGNGLFHHLIIPILSVLSYMFVEYRVGFKWLWLPVTITLFYGIIMVSLNYTKRVEGPYPFFMIHRIGIKKTIIWMVCLTLAIGMISVCMGYRKPLKTDLKFIYVHGLSGWGSYDLQNEFIPYWGLTGGDLIKFMNEQGYESYSASVDPKGSAWDRACELYAELTGTIVDYGAYHSKIAGHERFGTDFSKNPLMKDFGKNRFVLIGHSFGGATVRLFSEILRNGASEEIENTDPSELSDFFKGGNGDKLFALVTMAAPTNGTTAYDLYEDPSFDLDSVEIPEEYEKSSSAISGVSTPVYDGREPWDYASFDMHIDNALKLNEKISTFDDVLYFAFPYSTSKASENGEKEPDPEITENMFLKGATYMSKYTGTTNEGFVLDESWQSNDGLVNEISARAPWGEPFIDYTESMDIKPGVWTVMPTVRGDHMAPMGGLTKRVNVRPMYLKLAEMLAEKAQ